MQAYMFKDVLIDKAISSIISVQLPDIVKFVKIPFVGKEDIFLPNIRIYHVNIASLVLQMLIMERYALS